MKNLLIILLLLVSKTASAGLYLKCTGGNYLEGLTALVYGGYSLSCHDKSGQEYAVEIEGVGGGLDLALDGDYRIACPIANKKRILAGKPMRMVGPRVGAGIYKGIEFGFSLNLRGSVCFLGGINQSYGTSALITSFKVSAKGK